MADADRPAPRAYPERPPNWPFLDDPEPKGRRAGRRSATPPPAAPGPCPADPGDAEGPVLAARSPDADASGDGSAALPPKALDAASPDGLGTEPGAEQQPAEGGGTGNPGAGDPAPVAPQERAGLPSPGAIEMVPVPAHLLDQLLAATRTVAPHLALMSPRFNPARCREMGIAPRATKPSAVRIAQTIYRMRRVRERRFDPLLFGEPVWDILLDLFIAAAEGRRIGVSSACIGAAAPATTALRHFAKLAEDGVIERDSDPDDGRRKYVRLSPDAFARMEALLEEIAILLQDAP